ncbi:MAG: PH domain-containing protein [Actinomycetaceae bacterium]|nr:PH domain-containing protein [Actinomycetaceae bacterium]
MTDQHFSPSDAESASVVQPVNRRVRDPQQPEDPFNPRGVEFRGVSPALVKVRVIGILISAAILVIPFVVVALMWWVWAWIFVGVFVALHIWLLWLVPRQVRAIGYAETDSDLLIRKGIMFRSLTVVPYGRMQYVDVSEGPIARAYGIAEVNLHTASASTDATIPGLPAEEAARLRNQLAERGEAEMAGL